MSPLAPSVRLGVGPVRRRAEARPFEHTYPSMEGYLCYQSNTPTPPGGCAPGTRSPPRARPWWDSMNQGRDYSIVDDDPSIRVP